MSQKKQQKKLHALLSEQIGKDNPELDMDARHAFVVVAMWEHETDEGETVCVMSHCVDPAIKKSETRMEAIKRGGIIAFATATLHNMMEDLVTSIIDKGTPVVAIAKMISRIESQD
jgi:ABC-type multidrug transport system ATPase subunit